MAIGKKQRICISDHVLFPLRLVAALPIDPAFFNPAKGKRKKTHNSSQLMNPVTKCQPPRKRLRGRLDRKADLGLET